MFLSKDISDRIVSSAYCYLGWPFDWEKFNCVHFVRQVYYDVGIELPLLIRKNFPPAEFHLFSEEFVLMPIGHIVFFKRKESKVNRLWTHVAIIVSSNELIHCTRHLGNGVVITPKQEFMKVYYITPKI